MSRERRTIALDLALALLVVAALVGVAVVIVGSRPNAAPPQAAALEVPSAPKLAVGNTVVNSEIASDDTIHVTAWVRSADDVDEITVAAAPDDVDILNLTVAGDGKVAVARASVGQRSRAVALVPPSRLLYLSYDLVGAVDRAGTTPGRALASTTFVSVDVPGVAGPVHVSVSGQEILSAACTPPEETTEVRPCGRPDGARWRVRLSPADRRDLVAVQLDLAPES